jgi:Zn-dependent M28 family amino/carboxypeptidase
VIGRSLLALLVALAATLEAAPRFDGAAAFRHVERLVAFGPRPAGSAALVRARSYIVDQLKQAGLTVRLQPFEASTPDGPIKMSNIIGVAPGRRDDVIVIAGHYDTKFFPNFVFVGANDGGASAGLLLELARRLARGKPEFTYWIVFFDGEEARQEWSDTDGIYGSRHLAAELRRAGEVRRVRSVIVVDMIGDRQLNIRREAYSTPWLTDILWASARRLGHGQFFRSETVRIEDDHVPFLREQIPAALVIDIEYEPWHTSRDTVGHVSAKSLQAVGEVVLDALPALETALARGLVGDSK